MICLHAMNEKACPDCVRSRDRQFVSAKQALERAELELSNVRTLGDMTRARAKINEARARYASAISAGATPYPYYSRV